MAVAQCHMGLYCSYCFRNVKDNIFANVNITEILTEEHILK